MLAMLLLVTMVLVCWYHPRHADPECCAVLAMLPPVTMVLVCWYHPCHADRECCAVLARLLATAGDDGAGVLMLPSPC